MNRTRGGACVFGWIRPSSATTLVSRRTSATFSWLLPARVVSKKSSSASVCVWPRTNWSTGASMPGMAISAICAALASVNSGGLNCTGITAGSFGPRSLGSISMMAGTGGMSLSRLERF
jgi:hypothetical protein